jgi:hypothetical protein
MPLLSAVVSALALPATVDYAGEFSVWKQQHGKSYASADSEAKAFAAFAHNHETIQTHNSRGLSYVLGHNEFSDLTADEFFGPRTGYAMNTTTRDTFARKVHAPPPQGKSPTAEVNWVTAGAVTPVKNQASCGSCWAFSAVGAIEGSYFLSQDKLLSFSEQDLVSCDTTDSGCNGGLMDNAFKWVETNGIAAEDAYPYTSGGGVTGTCDAAKAANPVATVTGYTDVTPKSMAALMSAVEQQPVSLSIQADRSFFQIYKSGVMDSPRCGSQLDHGVLVVGYDSSDASPYWLVKNSWGATWGEAGYIKLGMASSGNGICGMYLQPSYPTGAGPAAAKKMVEAVA